MEALAAFRNEPGVLLLESALQRGRLGRYSFLTADPFRRFQIETVAYGEDPFAAICGAFEKFTAQTVDGLPPFQGGAAGLLAYELGGAWERLSRPQADEFELPDLAIGFYDWVIAWDHQTGSAWVISQGFPETEPARRLDRAARRLSQVLAKLKRGPADAAANFNAEQVAASALAGQWPVPGPRGLTSSFSREAYLHAVERVIEYIRAGDIFQANLSQRLLFPLAGNPLELYRRLRRCNPAPFAGYFGVDDWAVVSASLERFVALRDGEVETRPIKGTRQRRSIPEADLFSRDELRQSEKDQAENVMIVDLLRNDLSRVCTPGTVHVPQLCGVETYETVQHLVSEIRGRLAGDRNVWDLFRAVFPGGSITGAPKVRAMEIISELEPTVRGAYCGSLFYAGFDGTADSSILIRTFTCRRGWIQCPVGGGIVAQSDPAAEYEETLHKAEGMLRALV
jgi:para-aminobenzoate synthetase component 1